jgi:large conductance mechanosensitive channel
MRRLWNEFKSFAMSGNMLDLALGFIIGAAFAKLVESLANNVLMQFVAAIFGQRDFTQLFFKINGAEIKYGPFLTDLINFMMLAAVLFLIIKFIVFMGVGRGRAFGTQQCPYCREQISPTALVCKFCRQQLVDELPTLADARAQLDEQNRRKVSLPLPIPGRRRETTLDPPR